MPGVEALCKESLDILSPDERDRYHSLRHPGRSQQFLLGRWLLRRSLAAHMAVNESELQFAYGPNGKPELTTALAGNLAFSLSHARTASVVAVARAEALGVDFESLSRASSVLRIARRFFSETELHRLRAEGECADVALMALWGLKESIVKAGGNTIWEGLSAVRLAVEGENVHWLSPPPDGLESDWLLMCGCYQSDYALALALRHKQPTTQPLDVIVHAMGTASAPDTLMTSG